MNPTGRTRQKIFILLLVSPKENLGHRDPLDRMALPVNEGLKDCRDRQALRVTRDHRDGRDRLDRMARQRLSRYCRQTQLSRVKTHLLKIKVQ